MDVILQVSGDDYAVWVDDRRDRRTQPARVACADAFDTVCLVSYALGDGPGTRELCADSPEILDALNAACGPHRH